MFFLVVKPVNALLASFRLTDEEAQAPTADVVLLQEIRDLLAEAQAPRE